MSKHDNHDLEAASAAQSVIDAKKLICADLEQTQRSKRNHFFPALLLCVLGLSSYFVISGVRPDLLDLPPWQLAVQVVAWMICLLVFPAIGLGIVFPSRFLKIVLALGGVAFSIVATLGFPSSAVSSQHSHFDGFGCATTMLGFGFLLLIVGLVSGAFVQRRNISGAYWVATGVSMTALNIVTWHCPNSGSSHIMPNHVGGAIILLLIASAVGFFAHRRRSTFVTIE